MYTYIYIYTPCYIYMYMYVCMYILLVISKPRFPHKPEKLQGFGGIGYNIYIYIYMNNHLIAFN